MVVFLSLTGAFGLLLAVIGLLASMAASLPGQTVMQQIASVLVLGTGLLTMVSSWGLAKIISQLEKQEERAEAQAVQKLHDRQWAHTGER